MSMNDTNGCMMEVGTMGVDEIYVYDRQLQAHVRTEL